MYLERERFECLRRAVGWDKIIAQLTASDIDLIVEAYKAETMVCIDAYDSDLFQHNLILGGSCDS